MDERFVPGTELNRHAVKLLKREFLAWRDPPVDLPADSVIEEVVAKIARLVLVDKGIRSLVAHQCSVDSASPESMK